jgi:carbamoyltransferase
LGAAFYVWHEILGQPRSFEMRHAYWGPEYSPAEIKTAIVAHRLCEDGIAITEPNEDDLFPLIAREIAAGQVVGWFSGRAEWGPRSLGNRSILADPRRVEMKEVLNRRVKHRESFRPFAPAVLAERSAEFFESTNSSPFMTFAYALRPEKRAALPAATHVDGTCRVQTVHRDANPRFWKLIHEFGKLTGIPAVINTSFNDNEPIVCSPDEAIDCFRRTHIDVLVMDNFTLRKSRSIDGRKSLPTDSRPIFEVSR